MGTFLLLLLAGVAIFRYASGGRYRPMVDSAVGWALLFGAVGFALGFFGPMIFAPGANQGPLLGIFITGPGGFFLGLAWGVLRALRRGRG
ncbi:MAG TPA: hypothetical protein VFK39_11510 [Gemmatimonadaceae bacterium]|nr:hypothetical protein [Gemmatimonadaceae bacterium]